MTRRISPAAIRRAISANAHGIAANLPGQSEALRGQLIQVASCGSHSAGSRARSPLRRTRRVTAACSTPHPRMRALHLGLWGASEHYGRIVEEALRQAAVGVDAPVAQERPVAPHLLDARPVDLDDEDLLALRPRLGEHHPLRVAAERGAPELEPGGRRVRPLEADAVDGRDVDAVGDRVAALHGAPGVALRRALGLLLGGVPADGRRVEDQLGAGEGRQARRLREPLVPADQHADAPGAGVEAPEPEIARREVVLLVVAGVVGDVHLAVDARPASRRRR